MRSKSDPSLLHWQAGIRTSLALLVIAVLVCVHTLGTLRERLPCCTPRFQASRCCFDSKVALNAKVNLEVSGNWALHNSSLFLM